MNPTLPALVVTVCTAPCYAAIAYTDIPDFTLVGSETPTSAEFDVNHDGLNDLRITAEWAPDPFSPDTLEAHAIGTNVSFASAISFYYGQAIWLPIALSEGSPIGAESSWPTGFRPVGGLLAYSGKPPQSPPPFGAAGYLGVRLALPTGTHFGWVYLSTTTEPTVPWTITVRDFAYESTPDLPIAAGAIPSPGWASLLAAAGLITARRRRAA